jgi:hypothetical protein
MPVFALRRCEQLVHGSPHAPSVTAPRRAESLRLSATSAWIDHGRSTSRLVPRGGSRYRVRAPGSGTTRLLVHLPILVSRHCGPAERSEQRLAAPGGRLMSRHGAWPRQTWWRFGRRLVRGLHLPTAFEPAVGRRHFPMAGQPPPRRNRGETSVRMIVVVVHGRQHRHQMPADSVDLCESVEHRSPPRPRIAAGGEREGKRSARCDRLP